MIQYFSITNISCSNCIQTIQNALSNIEEITSVSISLDKKELLIETTKLFEASAIQSFLPDKYKVSIHTEKSTHSENSKWKQLQPLFLILLYITTTSILMHRQNLDYSEIILDFMGLFFIVFSFFKFLDSKGFVKSFMQYDPIAKNNKWYGTMYPFMELGLGLAFLFRFSLQTAAIVTIALLVPTTIGVVRTLLDKRKITCACLGSVLKLPMTEATFIENAIMIIMALFMLFT